MVDYSNALYILNEQNFLTNDIIIAKQDESLYSRIACVNYEYYKNLDDLESFLVTSKDQIQCICSNVKFKNIEHVNIGDCQKPSLSDYADGVDTMQFLVS